jgi:hypothetical protein
MVKRLVVPLFVCSMVLAACAMTPPSVSALMGQVAQASQAGSLDALRPCFATEGVTRSQIDQHVDGWKAFLDKGYHWQYTGITYVSLADASGNKSILPETVAMTQPTTVGGFKFAPNIKVIGFILVMFKQPDGSQGGETEPVGIASDGSAKIALIEPQK